MRSGGNGMKIMIEIRPRHLAHAAAAADKVARRHLETASHFLMRSVATRHPALCRELAEDEARLAYAAYLEARDLERTCIAQIDSLAQCGGARIEDDGLLRHSAEVPE